MIEMCKCLKAIQPEKPDFIEWSLLSGLCLLNYGLHETTFHSSISPTESNSIDRLQVQ